MFKKLKASLAIITTIVGLLVTISILIINLQSMKAKYREANDNYKAQITQTVHWKDQYGREVATTYQITLSKKELKHSSDSMIQQLLENNRKLGLKLNKTEAMLQIEMTASGEGKVQIKYDTIYHYQDSSLYVSEVDTFQDSLLSLVRVREIGSTIATYFYTLQPIAVNVSINREKEGKWKLINLIIPRHKLYKVDVTSSNPKVHFNHVKYIKVK